jgi:hypothetical protein
MKRFLRKTYLSESSECKEARHAGTFTKGHEEYYKRSDECRNQVSYKLTLGVRCKVLGDGNGLCSSAENDRILLEHGNTFTA